MTDDHRAEAAENAAKVLALHECLGYELEQLGATNSLTVPSGAERSTPTRLRRATDRMDSEAGSGAESDQKSRRSAAAPARSVPSRPRRDPTARASLVCAVGLHRQSDVPAAQWSLRAV